MTVCLLVSSSIVVARCCFDISRSGGTHKVFHFTHFLGIFNVHFWACACGRSTIVGGAVAVGSSACGVGSGLSCNARM